MVTAMIALSVLAGAFGLLLGFAAVRLKVAGDPIVERVDALLPQTQCGQCGYPGCRPYAAAIAAGEADINQCPPGGAAGIRALADLLGREPKPLNPENGVEKPKRVAIIDEQTCIGCTLCIQACPVDAILGAAKQMHTVIARECTGCELCIAPCPVNCIAMVPVKETLSAWRWPYPAAREIAADSSKRASDAVPVVKGSNRILAAGAQEIAPPAPVMPCIRCGACADVCPADLLPQQLYWYARAREFDKAQDYHLFDCSECGCCATVCPSHIPLVQYYRFAKTEIWIQERERQKAALARQRHEFRLARSEREKREKEIRLRNRKQALQQANPGSSQDPKKAVIAAAVARAKAKKAADKITSQKKDA